MPKTPVMGAAVGRSGCPGSSSPWVTGPLASRAGGGQSAVTPMLGPQGEASRPPPCGGPGETIKVMWVPQQAGLGWSRLF